MVAAALLVGACDVSRSGLQVGTGGTRAGGGGGAGAAGSGGATGSGGAGSGGLGGSGGAGASGSGGAAGRGTGGAGTGGAGGAELDASGNCKVDLASTGCSPTYAEEVAARCRLIPLSSPGDPYQPMTGTCGGYLAITASSLFNSIACFYDPGTRLLRAGHSCTDFPSFCDGRAFCLAGGPEVERCGREVYTAVSCPPGDAGAE